MDCEFPSEFDIIIIGTGIVESIVSAAASRIGKRVLHVDSSGYYGGSWASFNLDTIESLAKNTKKEVPSVPEPTHPNEQRFPVGNDNFNLKNFKTEWHIPKSETEDQEGTPKYTQTALLKESRKFNIDLVPKLQFARGDFVELLISSNIARYSEYRNVSRVLTCLENQLEVVPCSRSDVFANNKVTVVEKRMLMKLFMALNHGDEANPVYQNKTFKAFLTDRKLTPNIIHYVLYAISMSTDDTLCLTGIQNTKRFLNSLGRFGKTPFLFSMYGSGEITQAFCRLSAVFGGIFALSQPLNGLIFTDAGKFDAIVCGEQRIKAEFLVMGVEKAPRGFIGCKPHKFISRAIFITDKSILESEKEHLTLLLYPPEKNKNPCVVIELGGLTGTCPKDLYLVHLISKQLVSPEEDFKHCVQNLFGGEKAQILWSCYFSIPDTTAMNLNTEFSNVVVCPGPDLDLDYDDVLRKARTIFSGMYPDAEFLPRAPDPEDIIMEGEETEERNNEEMSVESEGIKAE